MSSPVKLGIVGLGRWAKVLTRAVRGKSGKLDIVAGFSRSQAKRDEFHKELGVPPAASMEAMLANPDIKGVILTVPNEQHWPLAEMAAKAGKHVYTEKPIAQTLEEGLRIAALEGKYNITVNAICPGFVQTDMIDELKARLQNLRQTISEMQVRL